MRTLRIINASADSRQIAYRSIQEINKDLDILAKDIAVPTNIKNTHKKFMQISMKLENRNEIMNNLNLIEHYDNIARKLVSIKAQLTYAFKDQYEYKAIYSKLKSLDKDLEVLIGNLLKETHKTCWSLANKETKKHLTEVTKTLKQHFNIKTFMLIDCLEIDSKYKPLYRFYIRLSNLQDDTGYIYPQYYIILSNTGDYWYSTTCSQFKLTRFYLGPHLQIKRELSLAEDLLANIKTILANDGIQLKEAQDETKHNK